VIFTGTIPYEEFKHGRPREYEELKASGRLKKVVFKREQRPKYERILKIFGFIFLSMGLILVMLIIYSVLFGYN
jgi:hypothetical protein